MDTTQLQYKIATGLKRAEDHLATDDGKRLTQALQTTMTSAILTFAGARGLRKICRRFGVELTRREAYGLLVAGAAVIGALDPSRSERIKRALTTTDERRKVVNINKLH